MNGTRKTAGLGRYQSFEFRSESKEQRFYLFAIRVDLDLRCSFFRLSEVLVMDEKMIRYRASIIAKKMGVPSDEAFEIAKKEEAGAKKALRKAKNEVHGAKSKKMFRQLKKKSKKTVYVVGGNVVDHFVSGGLPSLGKRK